MKGIILAGGSGTRLYPMTKGVNKHLLPIGHQPMILYPLKKLAEMGIQDVLLMTGPEHLGQFASLLGDGREWDLHLHFRVQERPGGIAEALGLAKSFVGSSPFMVLLGDNIFQDSLTVLKPQFPLQEEEALVVLKEVPDPERFGIAVLQGGKIIDIEEKPVEAKTNLCVTGIYGYTSKVFDIVDEIKPSGRGELEISDVNRFYVRAGKLKHHCLKGWWVDAGTKEALTEADELLKRGVL